MRDGSQEERSPSTSNWVEIVALSVSGLSIVGEMLSWPDLARTARICSLVAWISANVFFRDACDGRYLSLVGAAMGSLSHVLVRQSAHGLLAVSFLITASRGETRRLLCKRCVTCWRAEGDGMSRSLVALSVRSD